MVCLLYRVTSSTSLLPQINYGKNRRKKKKLIQLIYAGMVIVQLRENVVARFVCLFAGLFKMLHTDFSMTGESKSTKQKYFIWFFTTRAADHTAYTYTMPALKDIKEDHICRMSTEVLSGTKVIPYFLYWFHVVELSD